MSRRMTAIPSPTKSTRAGTFIVNEVGSDRLLLKIPMDTYVRCLAKCDEKSPEYVLLRNGIVLHEDPRKVMVHIRCDADKARLIRRILAKHCPEFSDDVHFYPDPA